MVLPFYKLAILLMKVFSKPMVDQAKKLHLKRGIHKYQDSKITNFFINFGNWYQRTDLLISRKVLNIEGDFTYKPLNNELAIDKGINFFYELSVYGVLIVLSLIQLIRSSKQSKQAQRKQLQSIKRMQLTLIQVMKQIQVEKQLIASSRTKYHNPYGFNQIQNICDEKNINLHFVNKYQHVYKICYTL